MFGRIMVPLDGSELAERALPCAERLARLMGATLHLVRVAGPVFETTNSAVPETETELERDDADFLVAEMRAAEAYLARVHDRLSAAGLAVHAQRVSGTIAGALLDYAREADIDLVVLCSHGRTGLARFPLGSVAEHLLRHGTTPVLLVRAFGGPVTLERAVVPLDGSEQAEAALGIVDQLARSVVREVTLVRVIETGGEGPAADDYLERTALRLTREHLACGRQVAQGDPARVIIDAAGTDKLVIMATHGRTAPLRWALGSVADRVTRGGAAAVLLVRVEVAPGTAAGDERADPAQADPEASS